MGICMGKGTLLTDLEADGRFVPQDKTQMEQENGSVMSLKGPVIFVLGGPGSGKITHCEKFVTEYKNGVVHINMTDLIQQHIVGNELRDFSDVTSKELLQVLLMELKMASNAKAYIISGYPRSMRDLVEYEKKLPKTGGVVLLNWHVKILEKQIEFGTQLGETVVQLAKMELKNYSKQTLPLAEYFDQKNLLQLVDGERQPNLVYTDFYQVTFQLLEHLLDSKVSNKPKPSGQANGTLPSGKALTQMLPISQKLANPKNVIKPVASTASPDPAATVDKNPLHGNNDSGIIQAVYTMGGPGSNKSLLASTFCQLENPDWPCISIGQLFRTTLETEKEFTPEIITNIKNAVNSGDFVATPLLMRLLDSVINKYRKAGHNKFVIDGFPRNLEQLKAFEDKYKINPICVLLDCNESELSRNVSLRKVRNAGGTVRPDDDDIAAVQRRMELYRKFTLPMLKTLDEQGRLYIVDGDSEDKSEVVRAFNNILRKLTKNLMDDDMRKVSTDTIGQMEQEIYDS